MTTTHKIVSLDSLLSKLARLRAQGKVIVFTNGCFDLLHYGHISYLEKAKGNNRILIVGVNSDQSVKKIKGPGRPIVPQKERAHVLAALACVDFVTIFNEETPSKVIKAVKPDVLAKGADWKGKDVVGSDIVQKVELIRYLPKLSSTSIIETIAKRCAH